MRKRPKHVWLIWLVGLLLWAGWPAGAAPAPPAKDTGAQMAARPDTAAVAQRPALPDTARQPAATTNAEPVGPDDVGSPLLLVFLLLAGVALVCFCCWLALLAGFALLGAGVLATGVVSASALWAAWRKNTWAGRGETFLRVAGTLGGLLGGVALGEGAHLLWSRHIGQALGLMGGAAAGLGAGLLLAALLLRLARAAGRWFAVRFP